MLKSGSPIYGASTFWVRKKGSTLELDFKRWGNYMVRIAIVEDDRSNQNQIKEYIKKYCDKQNIPVDVTLYEDGIDITDNYACQFDIIFCDIQMKIMNGLETARKIRKNDANVIIIFITNLSEYAIQGYEVEAIGYLLKPMNFTSFSMYLGRAINIIEDQETDYIVFAYKNSIKRIELSEIFYIDYAKHYVSIHTKHGYERVLFSMTELEKRLEGKCFSRCNSGSIVNLSHVQNLDNNVVTVNNNIISISRSRKKQFIRELTDYLGGRYT